MIQNARDIRKSIEMEITTSSINKYLTRIRRRIGGG
jgi:hypothetical protein